MKTITLDLYTEITCPWCLIGVHRLNRVIENLDSAVAIDIRHHPVILMPDTPPEGLNIVDLIRQRYGITDPQAGWARAHAEARASGLDLDLGRQPHAYPTLAAHTLVRLAGALGTQHALATEFMEAYFLDAANIGDPDTLAEIAVDHGFGLEESCRLACDPGEMEVTRQAVNESMASGIHSVPHYVINRDIALTGCVSEKALAEALSGAGNEQAVI
ncbi:MAG: polyketide synthase [Porticoccaceae bacterium]|nr:polyketide synthase [Porticoccaceae bacterium]